ncbi:MAG: S41 family peptidase [Gammaproteobacteria bacterium]
MKLMLKNVFILALGLGLGIHLASGANETANAASNPRTGLPLDELRTFTEVFAKIKSDYVEEVDDVDLLESAIRGMLAGLDPHSAYLDPDAYGGLQEGTSGEFGGLGIEVGMEDGFVKVIAPIDDTPAQQAGIKAGDLIVRLDDTPVKGLSLNDAVKMMRGKPGTAIQLTIVREGEEKPLAISVKRAVIKVQSVKSRTLEPQLGYVRISHFQTRTGEDLITALDTLKRENKYKLSGLILDLRNNPGGILGSAVAVADVFMEKGLIVLTKGRGKESELRFDAKPKDALNGAPIVVLVNGGSASASEIVAGALQDTRRAVLMGSKTFGKGSVQTILPMNNNAALKLTTARYYTPSGRSIQAEGIVPDIILDRVKVAAAENPALDEIKESNLTRHLSNGQQPPAEPTPVETKPTDAKANPENGEALATSDYELYEALNLLKGLTLQRRGPN